MASLSLFGVGGLAALVLLVVAIMLAIAPLILAHGMYQVATALRFQSVVYADLRDVEVPQKWIENAKKTPMANILTAVFLVVAILVAVVAVSVL